MPCDKGMGILERAAILPEPLLSASLSHHRSEIYAKPAGFLDQLQILRGVIFCRNRVAGLPGFCQKPVHGNTQNACQSREAFGRGKTVGFPLADSARADRKSFRQFSLREARTLPSKFNSFG
jgi:hypothetical protein